jgi:hypothetical protein
MSPTLRAFAWSRPAGDTVDATVELLLPHDGGTIEAWFHTRLARAGAGWASPIDLDLVAPRLVAATAETRAWRRRWLFCDAYSTVSLHAVAPRPSAERWPGRARERVVQLLGPSVARAPWMQDWPVEVAAREHLGPACAAYDAADPADRDLRFDLFALAVESQRMASPTVIPWFGVTARRDFANLAWLVFDHCSWYDAPPNRLGELARRMRAAWRRARIEV